MSSKSDQLIRTLETDSFFSNTAKKLCTGVIAVGFITTVTTNTIVLGLVLALPFFMQVLQLLFLPFMNRFSTKKQVIVIGQLLSRLSLLLIVFLPFIENHNAKIALIITSYFLFSLFDSMISTSWTPLVKQTVSSGRLPQYLSRRLGNSWICAIVITIIGGQSIGLWQKLHPEHVQLAYASIWLISILFSLVGVVKLWRAPDSDLDTTKDFNLDILSLTKLKLPLSNPVYLRVLSYLGIWNLATFISASFFTAYMLLVLKFSISAVVMITALSMIVSWRSFRLVERLSNKSSSENILRVATPLYLLCLAAWIITSLPITYEFKLLVSTLIMLSHGFLGSFINLNNQRIMLDTVPEQSSAIYFSLNSVVTSLSAGTGSLIGGYLLNLTHNKQIAVSLSNPYFSSIDLIFLASILVGMVAISFLFAGCKCHESESPMNIKQLFASIRISA